MPLTPECRAASIATRQAQAAAHAATTAAFIANARTAGAKTNVDICKYLNKIGSRTPRNCQWTAHTVGHLINKMAAKTTKA